MTIIKLWYVKRRVKKAERLVKIASLNRVGGRF